MTVRKNTITRLNRRTLIATSAASAVTVGGLAGKASKVFAAPAVLRQGTDVTLEVWGGVPAENGPADVVAAFMEKNPSVTVNYTRYVNDETGNTQLDTALQGGTQIDMFESYGISRFGQRIEAVAATDISTYVSGDPAIDQWVNETSGIFTLDDKYYGLPTTIEPHFIFLNQRMLEEAGAGLPPRTGP